MTGGHLVDWSKNAEVDLITVILLAVIDSRRNVEDVLLDRLIRADHENPLS